MDLGRRHMFKLSPCGDEREFGKYLDGVEGSVLERSSMLFTEEKREVVYKK